MKYYLAPLEGLTVFIYRNAYKKYFEQGNYRWKYFDIGGYSTSLPTL